MIIKIAGFTTKDGKEVEVCSEEHRYGPYVVFEGEELKQKDMTPTDCIRYLCHRLEAK